MTAPARSAAARKADTLARLEATDGDTWVATASDDGVAHLVPLSYAWDGECVLLAVEAGSATARNVRASRRVRLGFGPTRDVVVVDAELVREARIGERDAAAAAEAYAAQADWDPREDGDAYVMLFLRPRRIQAWREANELTGRLLMRDGAWLV